MQVFSATLHNCLFKNLRLSNPKYDHHRTNSTIGSNRSEVESCKCLHFIFMNISIRNTYVLILTYLWATEDFQKFNFVGILWAMGGGVYIKNAIKQFCCVLFHNSYCKI